MRIRSMHVWVVALLLTTSACDYIDRARSGGAVVDTTGVSATAGGFLLAMQMPGPLGPGQEGTIRLSLTNRGDTVPRGVTLDLLVPLWIDPVAPRPGDRPVTIDASQDEGLRFSYRMDDTALEPGQTQTIEQRIRIPSAAPAAGGTARSGQIVRARLIDPAGQPLVEVASQLSLDSTLIADSLSAGGSEAAVEPDRIGPVRLGMTRAALVSAVPEARDTTWQREGRTERGFLVPFEGPGRATVVLSGDTVSRIEVRDSVIRAHQRVGVGSTLEQLRAAYGQACAGVGDREVVVWFSSAPGLSFALDAPLPRDPARIGENPELIPATSRVTRWWVGRGVDTCP